MFLHITIHTLQWTYKDFFLLPRSLFGLFNSRGNTENNEYCVDAFQGSYIANAIQSIRQIYLFCLAKSTGRYLLWSIGSTVYTEPESR